MTEKEGRALLSRIAVTTKIKEGGLRNKRSAVDSFMLKAERH